tara:strand:- start:412 stop:1326 length:915 start_codon:yes stop_codon:yes gene_type:complete
MSFKIYFMPSRGMDNMSQNELLERAKRQTPGNKGIWKDMEGTAEISEADFYIILEATDLQVPDPNRAFYFSREPRGVGRGMGPMDPRIRRFSFLTGESYFSTFWYCERSGYTMTYDDLLNLKPQKKTKSMSCTVSEKTWLPGMKSRVEFVKAFHQQHGDKFDLFGRIRALPELSDFVLEIKDDDKYNTLENYKYCLAFDNGTYPNYFATQLTDTLLSWVLPVYNVAPGISNTHEFFPEGSYIPFDARNHKEIERIVEFLENDNFEDHIPAMTEARELILNKYNLWNTIYEAITEGKNTWYGNEG